MSLWADERLWRLNLVVIGEGIGARMGRNQDYSNRLDLPGTKLRVEGRRGRRLLGGDWGEVVLELVVHLPEEEKLEESVQDEGDREGHQGGCKN